MTTETTESDNQVSEPIKPYAVNKASSKVQDSFEDDGSKFVLTAEFKRLDSSNLRFLLDKEKNTDRITETLTKNRTREKLDVDTAHENFFNAIVIRGWLKVDDGDEEELSFKDMCDLNIEQKISLNVKYLDCKATIQKVTGSGKYDFLFKKDGDMVVEFLIGDSEKPLWSILLKCKRPPQGRRSKFREDFAYGVTNRGGDLPITKTVINLSEAVRFFDEYFLTVIDDPNYSPVHFLKEGTNELDHVYVEGNEEDRKQFIHFFNPHFKSETAGTMVSKFSKSSRE